MKMFKVYYHTLKGSDNGFVFADNEEQARQQAFLRYGHNVRKIVEIK